MRGHAVVSVAVDDDRMGSWGFLSRGAGVLPGLCIELGVAALEAVQRKEQCGAQGIPLAFELTTFVGLPFELELRVERREHMGQAAYGEDVRIVASIWGIGVCQLADLGVAHDLCAALE